MPQPFGHAIAGGRPIDDDRSRQSELEPERRPQRAGRYDQAIAEAADAVDHDDRKVLGQRCDSAARHP